MATMKMPMAVGSVAEAFFAIANNSTMITVPARSTYAINNIPSATKIITFNPSISEVTIWEDGTSTFAIENTSVIANPQPSSMNVYVYSYANNTITLKSESGAARNVWVAYM